jgi:hypothetical protein
VFARGMNLFTLTQPLSSHDRKRSRVLGGQRESAAAKAALNVQIRENENEREGEPSCAIRAPKVS